MHLDWAVKGYHNVDGFASVYGLSTADVSVSSKLTSIDEVDYIDGFASVK